MIGLDVVGCPLKTILPPALLLALPCLSASCATGIPSISCSKDEGAPSLFITANPTLKVTLPGRPDVCDYGLEFRPDAASPMNGFIILPPKYLGLASKSEVHRTSFVTGETRLIGELPASAERRSTTVYIDIVQQGGSIYLNTYPLKDDRIEISPTALELVVSGDVCLIPVERFIR